MKYSSGILVLALFLVRTVSSAAAPRLPFSDVRDIDIGPRSLGDREVHFDDNDQRNYFRAYSDTNEYYVDDKPAPFDRFVDRISGLLKGVVGRVRQFASNFLYMLNSVIYQ